MTKIKHWPLHRKSNRVIRGLDSTFKQSKPKRVRIKTYDPVHEVRKNVAELESRMIHHEIQDIFDGLEYNDGPSYLGHDHIERSYAELIVIA